ncbi:hypothetical protein F7P69_28965 [Cellulosimicrobium funkei]|nr:hypothetical protein [Cellulosimicrobium funkei]
MEEGHDGQLNHEHHGRRRSGTDEHRLAAQQARELLESIPSRPQRHLSARDHLCAAITVLSSLAAGLLALSGHPWWAVVPALAALAGAYSWFSGRQGRPNEPRFGGAAATLVPSVFTVWLALPIYRGIRYGDVAPFPEILVLAGLAPAAWLVFYLVLLVRR